MKFISNVKVSIKRNPNSMLRFIQKMQEKDIRLKNLVCVMEDSEAFIYKMELLHSGADDIHVFLDNLEKTGECTALQITNVLEDVVKGGLLRIQSGVIIEHESDYEINLVGGTELLLSKIKTGGAAVTGISRNVAVVAALEASREKAEYDIARYYTIAERESAVISRFTGLRPFPLVFSYTHPEDLVRSVRAVAGNFSALRLIHIDETDLFTIKQLASDFNKPVLIKDVDDLPVYILAMVIKMSQKNRIEQSTATVGILGLDTPAVKLTSLLEKAGFGKTLGFDQSSREMLSFENAGGMATSSGNILANSDIVIIRTPLSDPSEYERIRPGQYIISFAEGDDNSDVYASRGVRESVIADGHELSQIFPGMLSGMISRGSLPLDEKVLVHLGQKVAALMDDEYKLPGLFSDIHSIIADLVDFNIIV